MTPLLRSLFLSALLWAAFFGPARAQTPRPYTASFVGTLGRDTVLVETYTVLDNHLYGKAFIRVPEDYIGVFSIHFYPDGSIREFNVMAMNPVNSSLPFEAKSGSFPYRLNMNCKNDTCTFYNALKARNKEIPVSHKARSMNFVGGWVPIISLMEWNCVRLARSGQQRLPLKMINSQLGVFDIGVQYSNPETILFGGPFLEYTKINVNADGQITSTDGTGTPWNYWVAKHEPIDIDLVAKRMVRNPPIGNPSPPETIRANIHSSTIEVQYGRPFKRGRTIFGGIVPMDSVWRTGAGQATTIILSADITIQNTIIPKGPYSLYTIPGQNEWTLIFNTDLTTWPTNPDRSKDLAQLNIPVEKSARVIEQFTIDVQETKKGGRIRFSWDDRTAFADFELTNK